MHYKATEGSQVVDAVRSAKPGDTLTTPDGFTFTLTEARQEGLRPAPNTPGMVFVKRLWTDGDLEFTSETLSETYATSEWLV